MILNTDYKNETWLRGQSSFLFSNDCVEIFASLRVLLPGVCDGCSITRRPSSQCPRHHSGDIITGGGSC